MQPDHTEDEILDRLTGRFSAGADIGRDDCTIVLAPKDRLVRLPDIDALLALINDGSYDEHLEAILAAGHARKRERRGIRRPHGLVR